VGGEGESHNYVGIAFGMIVQGPHSPQSAPPQKLERKLLATSITTGFNRSSPYLWALKHYFNFLIML
jgi:hypothetical protein